VVAIESVAKVSVATETVRAAAGLLDNVGGRLGPALSARGDN